MVHHLFALSRQVLPKEVQTIHLIQEYALNEKWAEHKIPCGGHCQPSWRARHQFLNDKAPLLRSSLSYSKYFSKWDFANNNTANDLASSNFPFNANSKAFFTGILSMDKTS